MGWQVAIFVAQIVGSFVVEVLWVDSMYSFMYEWYEGNGNVLTIGG